VDCSVVYFKYVDFPILTHWVAKEILNAIARGLDSIEVTLDLGLSREKVYIGDGEALLRDCVVDASLLESIREDRVYEVFGDNIVREITIHSEHVYKLKPVAPDTAPTLEINGVHMHRIVGVTPWIDSLLKVRSAHVKFGHDVLDTCMGLGYTAIHSLLAGAREVVTVEIDPCVIEIARHNPWSRLLSSDEVTILNCSILDAVAMYDDKSFHRIIHDPPRFSRTTGDLYSLVLYREFYRLLKPGGILYHYTGEPGKHTSKNIVKGVGERLRRAGFIVRYDNRTKGYIAYKPL